MVLVVDWKNQSMSQATKILDNRLLLYLSTRRTSPRVANTCDAKHFGGPNVSHSHTVTHCERPNMKAKAFLTSMLIGVVCVSSLPAQQTATRAVSSVQRLPKNVYGHFSIPSVTELKARVKKSSLGQMVSDPEMSEFKAELMKAYEKAAGQIDSQVGLNLDEIMQVVTGEAAVAVVAQGNKIGIAVFADYTGSEDAMEKLLDKADEGLRAQGIESTTEEFADTEITVYKKGDSKRNFAYFVKDSQMVGSDQVAILEGILSRWEGGEDDSFESNDTYAYILERCGANSQTPAASYYFAPIALFQKAVQSGMAGNSMPVSMAAAFIPQLGLANFKAIGGTIDMGIDGFDTVNRTQMFVDQPASGVLKVFQLADTDQTPPEWVDENASMFMSANWTVSDAYDAIGGIVDMFQPPGTFAQMVDQAASDEDGPMIHVKKDLIDQMTGQIHVYGDMPDSEDVTSGRTVVALGCKDTDAMRSVLARAAESPGFPGESRDFRGVPLIEMPNPQGGEQKMAVAVANQKLMFSTDVTLIEKVLRGDKDVKPLAQSADYKRVAARFPAKTLWVAFQKQEGTIKAAYDMARDGELPALPGDIEEMIGEIDFSTLPPFESIRKYFPASGSYMVSDKNGAFSETFSLSP